MALRLGSQIDQMTGCAGTWKEDENIKLKGAVQTHGGKNWVAIAALVPDRRKKRVLGWMEELYGP
jgi:hypothetical protein